MSTHTKTITMDPVAEEDLDALVVACRDAAQGDSNDDEIETLQATVDQALLILRKQPL